LFDEVDTVTDVSELVGAFSELLLTGQGRHAAETDDEGRNES
jgi:hypothetical protein